MIVLVALAAVRWLGPAGRKPAAPGVTVSLYFHKNDRPEGAPVAARRALGPASTTRAGLRAAIEALLAGPTPGEKDQGYFTSIPAGSRLLDVRVSRPYAYLNLNAKFERTGGTVRIKALLEQLSYTAAAIPGVKGVLLEIDGERVGTRSGPLPATVSSFATSTRRPGAPGPKA